MEEQKNRKSRYIKPFSHLKINNQTGSAMLFTPEELYNKANEYFQECIENPWKKPDFIKSGQNAGTIIDIETETLFTFQGLCVYLGVNPHYLNDLENRTSEKKCDEHKLYYEIMTHIRNVITMQRFEGAAAGAFNPIIVSRLEGLTDKQEIKATNTNISVEVKDEKIKNKLDKE